MEDKKISEMSQDELVELVTDQAAAIASKDAELTSVKAELQKTITANDQLSKVIEQLPKVESAGDVKSFSVDGTTYTFNYPNTVLEGKKVSADDIVADKDLQAKLIGLKSGMITAKK